MNTQTIGKYQIDTEDKGNQFIVRVTNTNAKKLYRAIKHNYWFRTPEQRATWIADFVKREKEILDWKESRRLNRLNFQNPAKVDDILVSSWGYDQTNVDFYQIKKVSGKSIVMQKIRKASIGDDTGFMCDHVVPVPNSFITSEPELTKRVSPLGDGTTKEYDVTLTSFSSAYPWEGKPEYRSWYA